MAMTVEAEQGSKAIAENMPATYRLAGLAFMFSTSILLQILACALYNNWWPMLAALMYVLVPMPCLFFGGGSTQFLTSREGGGWFNAAKFLTGASAMGSIAIPAILRHAGLIETGAMFIEFTSFFILLVDGGTHMSAFNNGSNTVKVSQLKAWRMRRAQVNV
ncbi:hypothetical protein ABZP36_015312 [Zizania latifolia]